MLVEEHHEPAELTDDLEQSVVDLGEASSRAEMCAAIAAMYFESPERLDSRHLWTVGRYSYFRVNRWSGPDIGAGRIRHSAFLRVEELRDGWRICDLSGATSGRLPSQTAELGLGLAEVGGSSAERSTFGECARLNSAGSVARHGGYGARQLSSS